MKKLPHPGPLIFAARKRLDLTLEEVADAIQSTPATISRIENQKSRGKEGTLERLAAFFGIDPTQLVQGDPTILDNLTRADTTADPSHSIDRHSGLLRDYAIENVVEASGIVRGPLGGLGATGPAAALVEGLRLRKGERSGEYDPPVVTLAGVPRDAHLVLVKESLGIWIEGRCVAIKEAGKVLIVDTIAKPGRQPIEPGQEVVELVVAARDPDPFAKPSKEEPEPYRGRSQLMRYEPGPRGNELLYPLDSDKAVTTAQGWRIVGVVVDERLPQRRQT